MITFFGHSFSAWKILAIVLLSRVVYGILKYVLKRRQLSRKLPGMQTTLLDIRADLKNMQMSSLPKFSRCLNVYYLQVLSGYTQLFRSKMIFCFWMMYIPIVWVVKAQAVEELISGSKNSEKSWFYDWIRPWLSTGLLTSHGQKWRSRRKLLTPSFHFDILKDFLPTVNEKSQLLVNILSKETGKDWTDVSSSINLCTLDIICETTLGTNVNAQENSDSAYVEAIGRVSSVLVRRLSHPMYLFDFLFYLSDAGREFNKDVKRIHDFTRAVIRQKKAPILLGRRPSIPKKRKALMDVLLEHHLQNADLTEEDIREEVDTFTFAGHDTTSMGITWALYLIGLYKDVQDLIHTELDYIFGGDGNRPITTEDIGGMEYLDRVLKESQRLYPSVPMFGRRCADGGIFLNGYEIPEGAAIGVLTYELHRDPDVFPDPEKFDPDRFLPENTANRHPYAYIPFSAGPRNCIGQRFAVMVEKVIVANILRNYTVESLDPRDKVAPAAEMLLRSAEPLRIRIRYRTS